MNFFCILAFLTTIAIVQGVQKRYVFRYDDIEDYYHSDTQVSLLTFFMDRGIAVTAGIIGDYFTGEDTPLYTALQRCVSLGKSKCALFNHGADASYTYDQATSATIAYNHMKTCDAKIKSLFPGYTVDMFVPHQNAWNQYTLQAAKQLGYSAVSASIDDYSNLPYDTTTDPLQLSQHTETGEYQDDGSWTANPIADTVAACETAYSKGQVCVIMTHPHEFASGAYTYTMLQQLIDALSAAGFTQSINFYDIIQEVKGKSSSPTVAPTAAVTKAPTRSPTSLTPTTKPTISPSAAKTVSPTVVPTFVPTTKTSVPTVSQTTSPTHTPTTAPSAAKTVSPTVVPTFGPTTKTSVPTISQTTSASKTSPPTTVPSVSSTTPTQSPTISKTDAPTLTPSNIKTAAPSTIPTALPTVQSTTKPTNVAITPTTPPTITATSTPTVDCNPTVKPTTSVVITSSPTTKPTNAVVITSSPTLRSTAPPTFKTTTAPSLRATVAPTTHKPRFIFCFNNVMDYFLSYFQILFIHFCLDSSYGISIGIVSNKVTGSDVALYNVLKRCVNAGRDKCELFLQGSESSYVFGNTASVDDAKSEIQASDDKIKSLFPGYTPQVFAPSQSSWNNNTITAAKEIGFSVISASESTMKYDLTSNPIQLPQQTSTGVINSTTGNWTARPTETIVSDCTAASARGEVCVIQVTANEFASGAYTTDKVSELVSGLQAAGFTDSITFNTIITEVEGSSPTRAPTQGPGETSSNSNGGVMSYVSNPPSYVLAVLVVVGLLLIACAIYFFAFKRSINNKEGTKARRASDLECVSSDNLIDSFSIETDEEKSFPSSIRISFQYDEKYNNQVPRPPAPEGNAELHDVSLTDVEVARV